MITAVVRRGLMALGLLLTLSVGARAETLPASDPPPRPGPLPGKAAPFEGEAPADPDAPSTHDNPPGTPSRAQVSSAAARLGIPADALQAGVEGLGMIYARRYEQAQAHFERATSQWPDQAIGPLGHVLLYQSWMMENYDFVHEAQWKAASELGLARVERALKRKQAAAWNQFAKGAMMGAESFNAYRHKDYVAALRRGLSAMNAMEAAADLDPEFHDAQLGIGAYLYWRTIITQKEWYLPNMGDHRADGMARMEAARDKGIFTGPGARLALAYTYLQESRIDEARAQCQQLRRLYPDNVLNNIMLARLALRQGKHREAKRYISDVRQDAPDNWLVLYYDGIIAMRENHWIEARDAFLSYLTHEGDGGLESYAWLRLGDSFWQLNLDSSAREAWKESDRRDNPTASKRLAGETPKRKGQVQIYVRPPGSDAPELPEPEAPPPDEGEGELPDPKEI